MVKLRQTCFVMITVMGLGVQQTGFAGDITYGLGLSYVFGDGLAIGAKVFSNDEEGKGAAGMGLDYRFSSKSFRPNIGVAYLDNNHYVDLTAGWRVAENKIDFAIGAGWANTDEKTQAASTTATTGATDGPTDITGPTDLPL